MNYLRLFLLLFVMASTGLYAGIPGAIEKGSKAQQEKNLSVIFKDSQQDQNKLRITVTFKGDSYNTVNLINNGNNTKISTEVKDGMVSMSFEIEKANIEKSFLSVSSSDPKYAGANCGPGFLIYLKGYVV